MFLRGKNLLFPSFRSNHVESSGVCSWISFLYLCLLLDDLIHKSQYKLMSLTFMSLAPTSLNSRTVFPTACFPSPLGFLISISAEYHPHPPVSKPRREPYRCKLCPQMPPNDGGSTGLEETQSSPPALPFTSPCLIFPQSTY